MEITLEQDIYAILSYEDSESIQSDLRLEWINHIRRYGASAFDIPEGSLRTLHSTMKKLLQKNGSATPIERVKIRCIGALGLVMCQHWENAPPELSDICNWLFEIAVCPPEQIATIVSKRVWCVLESDRIIRTQ